LKRTMTARALRQCRRNVKAIAKRRRSKKECSRGHRDWYVRPDGRRTCNECRREREREARMLKQVQAIARRNLEQVRSDTERRARAYLSRAA
jgi:hypothetical protein